MLKRLAPERRLTPRYRCGQLPPVRVLARPSFKSVEAWIWDISLNGIGLLLTQAFAVGTVFAIQLRSQHMGVSCILSGRVRHVTPQAGGSWLMGCSLSRHLSEAEFSAIRETFSAGDAEGPPTLTLKELEILRSH